MLFAPGKVWNSDSDVIPVRSEAGMAAETRPVAEMSAASSCLCSCASALLRSQSREVVKDDSSAAVRLCSSAVSRSFQSTGANGKSEASSAVTAPQWPVTAHSDGITASAVRDLVAVEAVLCLSRCASEAHEDQEDTLCLCVCASAASQSESTEADSEGAGTAAGAAAASHDTEEEQWSNGRLDCGRRGSACKA